MDHATEVALLKRLLAYRETGTTAMAPAPYYNEVSAFTDPDRLAAEERLLFRKHPIVAGMSGDWPEPGSYRTDDFAGVPMLIVRGRDGRLRAFMNACRHRGAKVAQGSGRSAVFSCPYHAWTYDLDGRIRGIPDEAAFPGVRAERPALVALPLAERHGLVWVLPTPAADGSPDLDIDPWLGALGPELGSFGFETYHTYDRRLVEDDMNWKILVDTFHESYHIGFLHRDSLGGILHTNLSDFATYDLHHRQIFPRTKLERLVNQPEVEWSLMWNTAIIYTLFPNTVFVVQGDHVEIHRIFPRDHRVDRAVMETTLYVPKAPTTDAERRHWDKNMELVMAVVTGEDFPAGRSMQIGFQSRAQSHVVYGRNEPAMIHYHRALDRALAEAGTQRAAE